MRTTRIVRVDGKTQEPGFETGWPPGIGAGHYRDLKQEGPETETAGTGIWGKFHRDLRQENRRKLANPLPIPEANF